MFRFENPTYLYLLAVVVILFFLRQWLVASRKRRLRSFGDLPLLKELMPDVSRWRPTLKFWLLLSVLSLFILMLARPQYGRRINEDKRSGIETIIALDISNSMRAEDVSPNRLLRAKMMVERLIDSFVDDKIGLVVFAGDAFVQLPVTNDFVSAKMFLSDIDPSIINNQGTDLAKAINLSAQRFTDNEHVGKAIIVITDGEDHEGAAIKAAEEAEKMGIRTYVLGIGSNKAVPIPDISTGNYMVDNKGEIVLSRLNEKICQDVAKAGNGAYIHVDNSSDAQKLLADELDKLEKAESTTQYSEYDEQFRAVGIIALLLLIIEVCVLERKNRVLKRIKIFRR